MNNQKDEEAATERVCKCCGGSLSTLRTTPGEIATNVLCAVLLIAISIPIFLLSEQWIKKQGQRFVDRMTIWREPIDSWNL
ncbi:hypothetical protein [Acidisarcina polymorpha]|uniref:hypothetical protein n=1 Tax=Acidisarcina polymorpha TaxID=2211140 RepID=UPI000DF01C14|nr:hypothetical protein [Acidisarcina polymorpha]